MTFLFEYGCECLFQVYMIVSLTLIINKILEIPTIFTFPRSVIFVISLVMLAEICYIEHLKVNIAIRYSRDHDGRASPYISREGVQYVQYHPNCQFASPIDNIPDILIRVHTHTAPVNPVDINTIQGTDPVKPDKLAAVPENEGVGVVIKAAGDPETENPLEEEDSVIPIGPKEECVKIPNFDHIPIAITISMTPCTAFRLLKAVTTLEPRDCDCAIQNLIQTGGNIAVGSALFHLCDKLDIRCALST